MPLSDAWEVRRQADLWEVRPRTDSGGPDSDVTDVIPDTPDLASDTPPDTCSPQCDDKECGPDGCGGVCGICPEVAPICTDQGKCALDCVPDCAGPDGPKQCGPDGCQGSCGECFGQDACVDGACVCQPACDGKDCGLDGCGGVCGECIGDQVACIQGHCLCQPDCDGKDCGPDGCGGLCQGPCPVPGEICADGLCCLALSCDDWSAECGGPDDGCGGALDCGACGENAFCNGAYVCECEHIECEGACCAEGEDCEFGVCGCTIFCDGQPCGAPDNCGGLCDGPCPEDDEVCHEGACCVPECSDVPCGGDDGCGGTCEFEGLCPDLDEECNAGECICPTFNCGPQGGDLDCCSPGDICNQDYQCEACDPLYASCAEAGANCGNVDNGCNSTLFCGLCQPGTNTFCGPDNTCECIYQSCGDLCCGPDEVCEAGECVWGCPGDCTDKACGDDDGCGMLCQGPCPGEDEVCFEGVCCVPACDEFSTCGDPDLCGGFCDGPCPVQGDICLDGACCTPQSCDGAVCGDDDGCGGFCDGTCPGPNESCLGGVCACQFEACGGACCAEEESCVDDVCCAPVDCQDLGAECGLTDDGCGEPLYCGACDADRFCSQDLQCECLFDACGESCCVFGEECVDGACVPACVPDCDGKSCGDDDGCGDPCHGDCAEPFSSCVEYQCVCIFGGCGDSCCDLWTECQGDQCVCLFEECGPVCCGPDETCEAGACTACEPDCDGKQCGDDNGCGGVCFDCPGENEVCNPGQGCVCMSLECEGACCALDEICSAGVCTQCTPDCDGKQCGDDNGCGEVCFDCPGENEVCDPIQEVCVCINVECGGVCCPLDEGCVGGVCAPCTPDCDGKQCGDADGCGGICFDCPGEYEFCDPVEETCVCVDVECGGVCCAPDETCSGGVCT